MLQPVARVPAHGCREREREASQQGSSARREQGVRAVSQHRSAHCKARSAMQGPQHAPQTRSTATALSVALHRKHNLRHEKSSLWQAARADA